MIQGPHEIDCPVRSYPGAACTCRSGTQITPVTSDVQAGAVVWLKTGSPALMVTSDKRTDGLVMVEWFKGNELCRDAFDALNLTFDNPDVPKLSLDWTESFYVRSKGLV